jgi:glutathionyl-hydroquinone reductase
MSPVSANRVQTLPFATDASAHNLMDLCSKLLGLEIDFGSMKIHWGLNNGVYRAGFVQGRKADDIAVAGVAETPDVIDGRIGNSRFLVGEQLTETDTRLFLTSAQFDMASHGGRKCSRQQIVVYPLLWVGFWGKWSQSAAGLCQAENLFVSWLVSAFPSGILKKSL